MKRVLKSSLSILLAMTFIFSSAIVGLTEIDFKGIFAIKAEATSIQASGKCGTNVFWELDTEGNLTISGTGEMTSHPWWEDRDAAWFWWTPIYKYTIRSVTIEDGVTSVCDFAFRYAKSLKSIKLGNTIKEIGVCAFDYTTGVTQEQLIIPQSVTKISGGSFSSCSVGSLVILNPLCTIVDRGFLSGAEGNDSMGFDVYQDNYRGKIYGFDYSTAHQYCIETGATFVSLGPIDYIFGWDEIYNVPYVVSSDSYTINVKTLNEYDKLINAEGADVTIYLGKDAIFSRETDKAGNVTFTREELLNKGFSYVDIGKFTVSAHLDLGDGLELCSERVDLDGRWLGERLVTCTELVVDEPRWKPSLKVLINGSDVEKCKNTLKKYSQEFAQATNGHVIVNNFELVIIPDGLYQFSKLIENFAIYQDIDICMVNNIDTSAWGNVDYKSLYKGSLDNVVPGYTSEFKNMRGYNGIIWCPINRSDYESLAKTLCHESGHYLFGFLDEYASAAGLYGSANNYWQGGGMYSYDYTDASGKGGPNGVIESIEEDAAYWNVHCNPDVVEGVIDRPQGTVEAPENFGLMEIHNFNAEAIEMSRADSYNGVVSRIADYSNLTLNDIKPYTQQYFYSNASCEERMAYELGRIARTKGYSINYSYATQMQRADYWYAGYDNVCFSEISVASVSGTSVNYYSNVQPKTFAVSNKDANGCEFNFDGKILSITSEATLGVSIVDLDGNVVFSEILNEENDYTALFETPLYSGYRVVFSDNVNGESVVNEYYLETLSVNSDLNFYNESPTVSLYSENETNAVILYSSDIIKNGEFSSVIGKYNIISSSESETTGKLQTSLSYDLDIDYSSLTWFFMDDSEWVDLDTRYTKDDHGNPNFSCSFEGDGKYCLMAKTASDETLNVPTELTVSTEGQTTDGEVLVQFSDDNADILNYNIYYSTEPITAENVEQAKSVVSSSSKQVYVTVEDIGTTYYFAVQAVGLTGAKSEISENVTCTCSYTDSDNDGIPDFWLDIYYQLSDLDDIAGTDSDNDGLTNLHEYKNNTNPLNPDTDGDNVYDGIEVMHKLNPLEPMTDGTTDDYIVAYGTPDLKISDITFDDDYIYFKVSNETDGKAMRTIVNVTNDDGTVASWTVNVDSQSTVDLAIERGLLNTSSGFKIELDGAQITRDIDYSNNTFEYVPATSITSEDIILIKGSTQKLGFTLQPGNANEIYNWDITNNNKKIVIDTVNCCVTAGGIGQVNIKVQSLSGLIADCTVTVILNEGSGCSEFDYELIKDNTEVAIAGYIGEDTVVNIPETIDGLPVTRMNAECIPDGVTEVNIPSSIAEIDTLAFNSGILKSINVDKNNPYYSSVDGVLYNSEKTALLKVPVSYIKSEFNIPDTVTYIGDYAFQNCTNIISVVIYSSVTSIGASAFSNCQNMKYVFFTGSESEWANVTKSNNNYSLTTACIHYNATGHTFYEDAIILEPTCYELGIKRFVCVVCEEFTTEFIPELGHDYSDEWTIDIPVTCTRNGSKSHHCTRCDTNKDVTIIVSPGHIYSDWVVTKDDICTEGFSRSKTCSGCGDVITESTEPTGHKISEEWTIDLEPTCTADGSKSHHCTVCSYKSDVTTIKAKGHNYSEEWVVDTEPTCTTRGTKSHHCTICNKRKDLTSIDALGHSYSEEWTIDVIPTCTEAGSKSHHCLSCGDKSDITVVDATGHYYSIVNIEDVHPHTVSKKCLVCEDEKTETLSVPDCVECNYTIAAVDEKCYKLVSYIGTGIDVVVPTEYNGLPITQIEANCFKGNTTIKSVVIPEGVTNMGNAVFYGCTNLESITLPSTLTGTGNAAFYNCTSLKSVKIADGVKSIGNSSFRSCSALETIVIPDSITTIGTQALYGFAGTIYCSKDSVAHTYALNNNIKYVLVNIYEGADSKIDYENKIIRTDIQTCSDISEVIGVSDTGRILVNASYKHGAVELYGTGSIVSVYDGDEYIGDFVMIVEGDINGDSVCDILDCSQVELSSNGNKDLFGVYAMAADSNSDDIVDITDYQSIVNRALAS